MKQQRKDINRQNARNSLQEFLYSKKIFLTILSCMVVFVTTYLLILPAVTLDKDEAVKQGGIDVPAQAEQMEQEEQAEQEGQTNQAEIAETDDSETAPEQAREDETEEPQAEQPDVLSYDGKSYAVTADTSGAGLPEGTELVAEEISKDDASFEDLYQEALKAYQRESKSKTESFAFAKFYDISLLSEGEIVEPDDTVGVTISYKKALNISDADTLRIVHFGEKKTEIIDPDEVVLDSKKGRLQETSFTAESFSVYGVITVPGGQMDALNGRVATINMNGHYLTSNTTDVAGNPTQIVKTDDVTQAASWMFESDGNGAYYISTKVNGEKKYMNITAYSGSNNSANLTVSNTRQALNVNPNGNSYRISALFNGRTYYVNLWGGGSGAGFACWYTPDGYTNLTFTYPSSAQGDNNKYAVVVEYDDDYYVVQNDGSLIPVTYYPDSNMVEMEYPILWEYRQVNLWDSNTYNLRIATEASHFDWAEIADSFYYRYIDPSVESDTAHGTRDENAQNTNLGATCTLQYQSNTHHIVSGTNYIGVSEIDGNLHITGKNGESDAAVVYLARVLSVPNPDVDKHPDHAVNHIDISVTGTSTVTIPLAYGDYYDADGNVIYTATKADHKVTVSQNIEITKDDIKRAQITAFTKDDHGNQTEVDNAFYVTGYSGNGDNDPNQVRIEGSFKVADLPTIANADDDLAVRTARRQNKIYYSLSTVKDVEFTLKHNGEILYDSKGEPITVNVPVTVSSSFNYWDSDNKCPGIFPDQRSYWESGGIIGTGHFASGMDFDLGSDKSEQEAQVPAVEITKYIQREDGTLIEAQNVSDVNVSVLQSTTANAGNVDRKGIGEAISETDLSGLTNNSGYTEIHQKEVTIGESGMGAIYDYDIQKGMIYIEEDEDTVDKYVRDKDGNIYRYKSTQIETEYVKRHGETGDEFHLANGYTSVPEVVGEYGGLKNMFLEFYIYNVYEEVPKISVPVSKEWDDFESDEYDWSVTFRLQWAPKYKEEGTAPDADFADYYRLIDGAQATDYDMTITKDQMADPDASLADRTFDNLPKYGIDSKGRAYRIQYSLEEMSYTVTRKSDGAVVVSYDRATGVYVPTNEDEQYEAFYPHDAGELNSEDSDYYILATNHKKNTKDEKYIDVTVTKTWEDEDGHTITPDDWEAQFQILRYKGTSYRDISHVQNPDADPITVTLGDKSIQVVPGIGVRMVFVIGAHNGERTLSYSLNGGAPQELYHGYYQGNPTTIINQTLLYPTEDTTITYIGDVQVQSVDLIDTLPGTAAAEDPTYTNLNHTFTLNREHPSATFHLLRSNVSAGADDGQENINYFEYYFKELSSNPEGYYVTFTDSDGHTFGNADSRLTATTDLTATNRPTPPFVVKKEWRGVPEGGADNYPEIKFTLYQAETYNDNYRNQDSAWVYTDEYGTRYENIPLNAENNWTWNCPVKLPDKLKNGHDAKYYVVETTTSGNIGSTRWELYGYSTEYNAQTKQYDKIGDQNQPHNVNIQKNNNDEITGTLIIHNTLKDYMQMDVKKKFIDFSNNQWDTLTQDVNKNTVLGFNVIRKTYDQQGNVLVDWEDYGTEMLVGYDSEGHRVASNEGNPFYLNNGDSSWHWTILDQGGDLNSEHIGLPKHGFYTKEDGTVIPTVYAYSIRETGVYSNLKRDPWKDKNGDAWDWWSTITPPHAFSGDPNVVANEVFYNQSDYPVSDSDRINNYKASDLKIDKIWLGDNDNAVQEVYLKVYRYNGEDGTPEDFTEIIANDVKKNHNWQGYVEDPRVVDTTNKWLVLDNGDNWTVDLIIQKALVGSLGQAGASYTYHYYAVEVGYKDASGVVHAAGDLGKFDPRYDKKVGNNWENTPSTDPSTAQMAIGSVGQNAIRVINAPVTNFNVTKRWYNEDGTTPLGDDEIRGKTAAFKVKQYYTSSTKTEGGKTVPNWENAESRIITFVENADTTSGSQTLTIGKDASAYNAEIVSGTHDRYVLTSTDPADGAADWTLHLDGLQEMYTDDSGNVYYCKYELVETAPSGFTVTYDNNEISKGGTNDVTIKNTKSDVHELNIIKEDKNNSATKLKNAKFKIRKLVETNASTMETDTSFTHTPAEVTTDANGEAKFENLPIGIYEIEETGQPAGYVLADFGGKAYIKITASGMTLLKSETGKAPQEWETLTNDDQDSEYLTLTAETLTVKNESGAALPNSGGPGTTWLYLLGSLLLLGSGILLAARRRMEH